MENRYLKRIREIRAEQKAVNERRATELEDNRTEAEIRDHFIRKTENLEGNFRAERDRITKLIESEKRKVSKYRAEKDGLSSQFRQFEEEAQYNFESARRKLEKERENLPSKYKQFERDALNEFRTVRNKIKEEEARLAATVREEFYREVKTSPKELSKGIRAILEVQRLGNDFEDAIRQEKRYETARKLFNEGAWKTWKNS